MKKSLLIITLLVAVACLPATAQQLVKKRTSLSLVKKRAFGLPLKAVDGTPQTLSNVVLGAYYPASASGVDGKENYYLVLANKADVTYSITEGTITATDAHVALLDLYAPEGNALPFIHIFDNSQHLTFAEEIVKSCFESCISWT